MRGAEVAVGRGEDGAGFGPGRRVERVGGSRGEGEEAELVRRRPAEGSRVGDVVRSAGGGLQEVGAFVDGSVDALPVW